MIIRILKKVIIVSILFGGDFIFHYWRKYFIEKVFNAEYDIDHKKLKSNLIKCVRYSILK